MTEKQTELLEILRDGLEVQNDVIDRMIENLNELEKSLRDSFVDVEKPPIRQEYER